MKNKSLRWSTPKSVGEQGDWMDLEFQGAKSHLGGEGEEGARAMVEKRDGEE